MKKIVLLFLFAFTSVWAQTEDVKFSASVKNRNSDSIVISSQRGTIKVLKADAKGNFKDSFTVQPGFYQLFDGAESASLYLKNGYDLTMTMDAKLFDETITFKGKGEKENNFLAKLTLDNEVFSEKLSKVSDIAEQTKMMNDMLSGMETGLQDQQLDESFRNILGQQIKAQRGQIAAMAEQAAKSEKLKGQPSPSFAYDNFKGGTTKLEDFKGKYVYIDVWATWCGPCRQEIPHLQKMEEDYHGKNIEFVSISVDKVSDRAKWQKMVTDKSMGGVQLFADKDWSSEFIKAYGINSIPRFILIGPDGKIVDADAKRPSEAALRTQLDTLLK